ncbi:MAG TPA: DUF4920 domain-containing protein [Polyangiaceae bacterium]
MLKCTLWSLPVFVALACETAPPAGRTAPPTAAPASARAADPGVGQYGAPIAATREEKLASLLSDPARWSGQTVLVSGHVRRACSKMGCWMELSESGDPASPACRVIMKNHAFFVPKDSAGSSARVEGVLEAKRIEPAQVTHMEQEGAQFSQKAADGSAQELRFVASGVELRRGT